MIVLMFCIAFGLSMDYEVFLLSRIKEDRDQGAGNTDAVVGGLARTGRIVSAASALLSITFLAFGTADVSFLQMFGVGTAIAIVLDATVIRGLLVPAFMRLAGDANWWAPAPLPPPPKDRPHRGRLRARAVRRPAGCPALGRRLTRRRPAGERTAQHTTPATTPAGAERADQATPQEELTS